MDHSERLEATGAAPAPLPPVAQIAIGALTLAAIAVSIHQLFNIRLFGIVLLEGRYLYVLAGLFLALTFVVFPYRASTRPRPLNWALPAAFAVIGGLMAVVWSTYLIAGVFLALGALSAPLRSARMATLRDWALFVATLAASGYFVWSAETALDMGWEFAAPDRARWISILLYVLILDGTRRAGGLVLFVIVLLFSLYPTVADQMPGPIAGFASPFWDLAPYHMISSESSFGIPMRAFSSLVIGFILFGAVLQQTGGGKFFNDLALALVGRYRGGAAKVAIFASGFMGSMSGSVISNVLTTGAVSIPAMKRTGFSARHAAATEACASTGGVLMPPIMGATAFVMASFLSRPYIDIALAAAIPSLLFYFGLFAQIDAYAARRGLKGLERSEVPSLRGAMREGWPYILVFAVLIYLMVALRMERLAPFYATGLLLLINQLMRRHRFTWASFGAMIVGVGKALAELTAVLLGVGLIVGAFSATGLAGTLVNELIFIAGDSTIALLFMGAVTAFIFGMGMTVTACYIFLAVVLAPALEQAGLNQLAVHLFILYWGMVSYITPPVALGAFAAATMAGAGPMRTGLEAMRLGGVIYVAPFLFILNPALVGEGSATEIMLTLSTALCGIWLISSAFQGHVSLIGGLGSGVRGAALRAALAVGGLLLALPGGGVLGMSQGLLFAGGLALSAPALMFAGLGRRARPA